MERSYKLKEGVKTALVIVGLWVLFVGYLVIASDRIQGLDENSYTETGRAKAWEVFKQ